MFKGNDARLIAAFLAGQTLDKIADAAGVSRRTVQRRLRDPEFRARVDRENDAAIRGTVEELAAGRSAASRRLRDLVDSENETVALRASVSMLRVSRDYTDLYELTRRTTALDRLTDVLVAERDARNEASS